MVIAFDAVGWKKTVSLASPPLRIKEKSRMNRVVFAALVTAALPAIASHNQAAVTSEHGRPNVLLIITDQQFGDAMSCVIGNEYLNTPHMDSLAKHGMRFRRAYSPNPLCVPMRTSMITGLYPHQTGVQTNGEKFKSNNRLFLGRVFKQAGYTTAYFGKWHIPLKSSRKDIHGFDRFVGNDARLDPKEAAAFLRQKHTSPFFAVASFLSPHEICEWARKQDLPGGGIGEPPRVEDRPPLRDNSRPPENETDIMTHMRKSYQADRLFPVGNYTESDWRRHIWGYYRLIERADSFVGVLLDALRESGKEEDTVVVFLSDHGDCHGAHRWNQKTVFYDESSRVPFIISYQGRTPQGTSDLLVNVGVDVFPTLCEFAGIIPPADLPGLSVKAPACGGKPELKRKYVVSQNHMVQCQPVDGKHLKPHGRMVRSERYKYCLYSEGERRESLVDMEKDPGEMVNQAGNPEYKDVLDQHRAHLKEFAATHGDTKALQMLQHVASKESVGQ
jgi:choline-sulfatase